MKSYGRIHVRTISFDYELKYDCELADKAIECKPMGRIYFDAHFIRSEEKGGIVNIDFDENDPNKVYSGKLIAEVPDDGITPEAKVGIAVYAEKKNENHFKCWTAAGTNCTKILGWKEKVVKQQLPLIMQTSKLFGTPVEKGKLTMTIKNIKIGQDVKIISSEYSLLSQPIEAIGAIVDTFISQRVAKEDEMVDTWPGIKNVRAPYTISADGIETTKKFFIPIEGFALSEPLVTNEAYFYNNLERAMKDRGLTLKGDYIMMDLCQKAELLGEIINVAKEFDYISDTLERHNRKKGPYDIRLKTGFEEFSNMGVTLSGDCEDGAKLIQDHFRAFLVLDIKDSKELQELQKIATNYIYFMTLATVHGAKAEDKTEKVGAHLYGALMTKTQVLEALEHTAEGRDFKSKVTIEAKYPMTGLVPMFCEGTGRIRPLGPDKVDPLYNARRYVGMNMYTKGGLKSEIPHTRGAESNFYLGNLAMITDYFLEMGHNVGSFVCGAVREDGKITRGSHFVDLINNRPNVALIPSIPLSDEIMALTREAVTLRVPPQTFLIEKDKPFAGLEVEPSFERMKKTIANLNRKGSSPHGSVDYFIRGHQFTPHSMQLMTDNFVKMTNVTSIDYKLEHITNKTFTYRLMIRVNADKIN